MVLACLNHNMSFMMSKTKISAFPGQSGGKWNAKEISQGA